MRLFPERSYDQSRTYAGDFADAFDSLFPPRTGPALAAGILRITGLGAGASVLEFGVGNGRVLVPLAQAGLRARGLDSSPEMLARTEELARAAGVQVETAVGDVREGDTAEHGTADLVLCVGATIGMMPPEDQERLLQRAALAVRPGGWVVIEAHHVDLVRAFHAHGDTDFRFPHDDGVILARSTFDPGIGEWWMRYSWEESSGGAGTTPVAKSAEEFSFTTDPAWQDDVTQRAGLALRHRHGSWDGDPVTPQSPTVISSYTRGAHDE